MPERSGPPNPQRFEGIDNAKVTAKRTLFFSEVPGHANKAPAGEPVNFFITVDGQASRLFDPNNPPAIVTTKGAVEDWTIQNRTFEVHEFHIHQIHFKLLEENGVPVPKDQQQWYDTYQVGYWDGESKYPYIKVRMDFRGAVVGDFVYHCHILDHEDGGMMAIIRVKPPGKKA
jgi:FtsP/CotA-like multicopper oxidase with cupredoxin domain